MKKKTKILFFPSYYGGGFGHIGRCLALAQTWSERGGQASFAMNGPHVGQIIQAGFQVYPLRTPKARTRTSASPAYLYIPDMSYQLVRDGFDHPNLVFRCLAEAAEICTSLKPDLLIGDSSPITYLVGKRCGIPVVQLVKSIVHPLGLSLGNRVAAPEIKGLILPDARPVFNPVFAGLGLQPIQRAEDLLQGDLHLLSEIPELDPIEPIPSNTHYVGAITRKMPAQAYLTDWLRDIEGKKPVVYISIGGASHIGFSDHFFKLIVEALGNQEVQAVVSLGGLQKQEIENLPANIHFKTWLPTAQMLEHSHFVIFHGGGHTRMEILLKGLPSMVIPFHTEQEYYGGMLEKQGAAVLMPYSQEPYRHFTARWRGGGWLPTKKFSVLYRKNPTLQAEMLRIEVLKALADTHLHQNARCLQEKLTRYGGCAQVIELITQHLIG